MIFSKCLKLLKISYKLPQAGVFITKLLGDLSKVYKTTVIVPKIIGAVNGCCVVLSSVNVKIYHSYDSRTGDPGNRGLWSEPAAFGERAYFRVGQSPAVLSIKNLTKEDGGVYTCR